MGWGASEQKVEWIGYWMGDTPGTVMTTRASALVKRHQMMLFTDSQILIFISWLHQRLRVDIYSHTGRISHVVRTIIATCGRKVGKHENILMLLLLRTWARRMVTSTRTWVRRIETLSPLYLFVRLTLAPTLLMEPRMIDKTVYIYIGDL